MNYGYFPGCSLTGTAKEFDSSVRVVLSKFNIQFDEINDWSCCGASSAHATSHLLSVALPAKNLFLAKQQGFEKIFAPCAACFNKLILSKHEIDSNKNIRSKIEDLLEEKYSSSPEILNIVQLFHNIGLKEITAQKQVDLSGLKAACYYGCLLVRPNDIDSTDDTEEPKMMEEVVSAAGAKTVKWNFKTECCGASHSIAHTDIVEKLSKKIIDDAEKNGADLIIVACPMCHSNLDMRQLNIKKHNPELKLIPVLYLTQLVGLALGIEEKKLGLNLHFIDPMPLLKSKLKIEAAV
ncbi:MAG: CoB--CoM heterodisulfide reductase iron-sulfur subunit B family protein [Ignavibacteriaceae bacterium]|jgi:heterodisulfide reductase subunit B